MKIGIGKVKIDGYEKELRFDMNAFAELEELTGKSTLALMKQFENENDISFKFVRDALYCGMKWGNKRLTPAQVGKLMDFEEFGEYAKSIANAITSAFGKQAKKDADEEAQQNENFTAQSDPGTGSSL